MRRVIIILPVLLVLLAGCSSRQADFAKATSQTEETRAYSAPEATVGPTEPQEGHATAEEPTAGLSEPQETQGTAQEERKPDVIFVPTPQEVVDKMLELAQVKKDDLLYDLGCGDGRIVVTAAKRYGCRAIGYDIDPQRVKESLENVRENKVEHLVTIEQKDIFTLDLSEANVITLYLLPRLNVKLIPQLEKLRPGSRIVSHDFRMRGVKPDQIVQLTSSEDHAKHEIYFWTSPLKKRSKKPAPVQAGSSDILE